MSSGWQFPVLLGGGAHKAIAGFRDVVALLCGEPVIYGYPDPAEAPRPETRYCMIHELDSRGIGAAHYRYTSILGTDQPDPDLRFTIAQAKERLVRVWAFGPGALYLIDRLIAGYRSPESIALWDEWSARALDNHARDDTELLGQHFEERYHADFLLRFRCTVSNDIYSIASASASISTS